MNSCVLYYGKEMKYPRGCVSNNQRCILSRIFFLAASLGVKVDHVIIDVPCFKTMTFNITQRRMYRVLIHSFLRKWSATSHRPLIVVRNRNVCSSLKTTRIVHWCWRFLIHPRKSCPFNDGVHFCGFFLHLCSRPRRFPHLLLHIPREKSNSALKPIHIVEDRSIRGVFAISFPHCHLFTDLFYLFFPPSLQIIAFDELKTDYKNPIDQCNSLNPVRIILNQSPKYA